MFYLQRPTPPRRTLMCWRSSSAPVHAIVWRRAAILTPCPDSYAAWWRRQECMRTLSAMGSMVGACPETALLLCCARTTLDAERVAWISELLQKELDWPALL